jgi:release factor H-coupled RctB family protein
MGRGEAVAKFKGRFTKQSLIKTDLGGEVLCDNPQLLYEEHPRAYKAIEPVISSLIEAGAAERVAALEPLLTYKMSEVHDHAKH